MQYCFNHGTDIALYGVRPYNLYRIWASTLVSMIFLYEDLFGDRLVHEVSCDCSWTSSLLCFKTNVHRVKIGNLLTPELSQAALSGTRKLDGAQRQGNSWRPRLRFRSLISGNRY